MLLVVQVLEHVLSEPREVGPELSEQYGASGVVAALRRRAQEGVHRGLHRGHELLVLFVLHAQTVRLVHATNRKHVVQGVWLFCLPHVLRVVILLRLNKYYCGTSREIHSSSARSLFVVITRTGYTSVRIGLV